ncbi:UNVERIFIED_CONTAM: hypothetical protein FKN15_027217 [Acipenser sinensis]
MEIKKKQEVTLSPVQGYVKWSLGYIMYSNPDRRTESHSNSVLAPERGGCVVQWLKKRACNQEVQIPPQPLTHCVTLSKSLHLLVLRLSGET